MVSATRRTLRLTAAAALLYGAGALLVWLIQPRLLYFPGPAPDVTPGELGLDAERVTLGTADGERLDAWFLPAEAPRGVVIFSHGNAGNLVGRVPAARSLREMGYSVLLYDYRGFGASTGSPGEEGTYLDAEAAYRWTLDTAGFEPRQVIAYGRSLGGGVAVELALRQPLAALVLECTFTSIPDMAARLYPWIPLRWFPCIEYDNLAKIGRVEVPIAIAHSADDQLVPVEMGAALAEAAAEPVEWLPGTGGHNGPGALGQPATRDRLERFLRAAVGE